MIKNYGVYELGYEFSIDYMSDEGLSTFVPLNYYNLDILRSKLDFTWHNVKFLAIF